jgi:cell division septal protein FtsQ
VLSVAAAVSEMHAAESLPKTTRIGVATSGEVTVTLEGGAEIRLGDVSNLKEQLRVAAEIIQRYLRDNKTIEYIDARVPERPAVKAK